MVVSAFDSAKSIPETRIAILAYGGLAAWVLLLAVGILVLNDGRFIYTLDDPYIHLAMSEGIHAGGYGINPHEAAAAASSILFPYLLAWAAPYGFHEYVPFAINVVALVVMVFIFRAFLKEIGLDRTPRGRIAVTVISAALPILMNLVGLIYMGMEHPLQVLLDAAIFLGLVRMLNRHRVDPWLPAILVLAPLVRYESLLISGLALLVMLRYGWWKLALPTALLIAGSVGAFSLYLLSLGLSPMPSSVAAHSNSVDHAILGSRFVSILYSLMDQAASNFIQLRGPLLLIFAVVFGIMAFRPAKASRSRSDKLFAHFGWLACLGYLFFGKTMGMGRHETAILTLSIMILIYLMRTRIAEDIEAGARSRPTTAAICLIAAVSGTYVPGAILVPLASNNIYEQQYQMHRLITEFIPGPVAVNDIGWVAYRNEAPVLDLWGLASPDALRVRKAGFNPGTLAELTEKAGVRLIMIYDEWIPTHPTDRWTPLARLRLSKPPIYADKRTVALYAPAGADIAGLRAKLREFARTIPPGASLDMN